MEFDQEQVVKQKQVEIEHLNEVIDQAYLQIGIYKDNTDAL